MKRIIATAVILAAASCAPAPAAANWFNGNDVHGWCSAPQDSPKFTMCIGYVGGAVQMGDGVLFCVPEGVTVRQSIAIVMKMLEQEPAVRNLTADVIIANTLRPLWPCQQRQQRPSANGNRGA